MEAFAHTIRREKSKNLRFLALEYDVGGIELFANAWQKAVKLVPQLCGLFENLMEVSFIPHGPWNRSDKIKARELDIIPWREYDVLRGRDDQLCAQSSAVGQTFGQWTRKITELLLHPGLRISLKRPFRQNLSIPLPKIEFVGRDPVP